MISPITVFDLEFTAWAGSMPGHWLAPGEFKEVVQIRAVTLDPFDFSILDEFNCLVRPRINPHLSPYLEELTGITNEMVARAGVDFADAYRRFAAFAGKGPICAFGHDEAILAENIRLHGLCDLPPLPDFVDLRGWFAARRLDPRGLCSCDIAPALGLKVTGRAHDALDDARSMAIAMAAMVARGESPALQIAA
jgi:inhibitor of KinA sporulation pathway (predicted exonuclease)